MDSSKRITQLEREVQRLETRVARLQNQLAASGLAHGLETVPQRGYPWTAKLMLLAVTSSVAFAAVAFLMSQDLDWTAFSRMGSEMAALPINYELLTCTGAAALSLLLYLARRRLTFVATAMATLYLTYWYLLSAGAEGLTFGERGHFLAVSAFLSPCYLLCCGLCVREGKLYPRRSGRAAFLALLNSAAFYAVASSRMREALGPHFWVFLLANAAVLTAFAVLAETKGRTRNYVMPLFLIKSVLAFTLFLGAIFDSPFLWVALAAECFALALLYRHTGIVLFKVLNLVLLAVTTAACIGESQVGHAFMLGQYALPDDWLLGVVVPAVFIFTAWLYEHFADRLMPAERRSSGHWFLADGALDVPSATAAMLHAAGAALIPVLLTIANRGDQPTLPFVLGVESLVLAVLGLVIRTQQVEVAALLLLVAAHVSFYFFLAVDRLVLTATAPLPAESLPAGPLTVLLILFSFAMGYGWERYLRRIPASRPWEHDLFAAIPYLLATLMAAVLIQKLLPDAAVAPSQAGLALVLTLLGLALPYGALSVAGLAGFVYSGAFLIHEMYRFDAQLPNEAGFLLSGLVLAGLYAIAERAFALLSHRQPHRSTRAARFARNVLTVAATAVAVLVLREGLGSHVVLTGWLGLAATLTCLGWVFSEDRYRWAAVALLVACAMAFRQPALQPVATGRWVLDVALGTGVTIALAASWYWTFRSGQARQAGHDDPAGERSSAKGEGDAAENG